MHLLWSRATYQSGAGNKYAFRAPKSCIHMHPKNLPDAYRKKGLKTVHKRFCTEGTRAYAAKGEEASDVASTTAMYFERWGLLAPPFRESVFEGYVVSALPHLCYSSHVSGVQHQASWRAGVQETVPLSD